MRAIAFNPQEIEAVRKPREQATWLPARAYHDPDIYRREFDSIFAREWMPVAHESELPALGDYKTLEFSGQPLLLVRGPDKRIQCFINACRHRGMAVVEGAGNASRFRCPYHAWTYDLNGMLTIAPLMQEAVCGQGLVRVHTEVWLGMVFVCFSDQPPALGQGLERVASELAPWLNSDLTVLYQLSFTCNWNWKLMWENGIESYHVLGTHLESIGHLLPTEKSYISSLEQDRYFVLHTPYARAGAPPREASTTSSIPYIGQLPSWALSEIRYFFLWPTLAFTTSPNMLTLNFIIPETVDRHVFMWIGLVPAAAKGHESYNRFREQQMAYSRRIQDEDAVPCARIQKNFEALRDRYVTGPYNRLEAGVWKFHQEYLDRIQETV